jgi:HAD superfamily phosphoserine phosphatase-like hydrolase
MKLAIFDFCDTIVNFQSADAFIRFSLKKNKSYKSRFTLFLDYFFQKTKTYSILYRLNISKNLQKNFLLKGLKNISVIELNKYAKDFENNVIQQNINQLIYSRLVEHIKNNDLVVINSGGYEIYLKYFVLKTGVIKLYATNLAFDINSKFMGKIDGKDCLNVEKINKMTDDDIDFKDFDEIFVYSDSSTDMPLFDIATTKIAVIKDNEIPEWCNNESFKIIKV